MFGKIFHEQANTRTHVILTGYILYRFLPKRVMGVFLYDLRHFYLSTCIAIFINNTFTMYEGK